MSRLMKKFYFRPIGEEGGAWEGNQDPVHQKEEKGGCEQMGKRQYGIIKKNFTWAEELRGLRFL